MASNDYDDLLESFMSNSTKAYNEDKTNRENADTVSCIVFCFFKQ